MSRQRPGKGKISTQTSNGPKRAALKSRDFRLPTSRLNSCPAPTDFGHINLLHSDVPVDHPSGESHPNLILKDLSLTIAPGEKIAICGRTGRYILPS